MATVWGNEVSYDGGKFKVGCVPNYTNSATKFKPCVQITDAFDKAHSIKIDYYVHGDWVELVDTATDYGSLSFKRKAKGTVWPAASLPKVQKQNGYWSVPTYTLKIRATIGNKKSTVTITSTLKPKPTITKIEYENDSNFRIWGFVGNAGMNVGVSPPTKLHLYRQVDTEAAAWQEVYDASSPLPYDTYGEPFSDEGYVVDPETSEGHRYRFAVSCENGAGESQKTIAHGWYYTTPPNVTDVNVTKVNDYDALISYNLPSADIMDRDIIGWLVLQRSTDGGAFVNVGTMSAKATSQTYKEIHDKSITTNHYYRYKVQSWNEGSLGDSDGAPISQLANRPNAGEPVNGTDPIYTTPNPPRNAYIGFTSSGNVSMQILSDSVVATETEIQRSTDGGTTWDDITTLTFEDRLTYTDTNVPLNVTIQYRFRNTRDDLISAWSKVYEVIPLTRPNPPTLLTPFDGASIQMAETVRLTWMHNPLDNTPQTKAEITIYLNGEEYDTITVNSSNMYYDLPTDDFSAGDDIWWAVKTWGEYTTSSNYSEYNTFTLYDAPQLLITEPQNNDVISELPLHFDMTYSDGSGDLDSLKIEVRQDNDTVLVADLPIDNNHIEYDLDYLFENNTSYNIIVTATSTSGLSARDIIPISVAYQEVSFAQPWFPDVNVDEDTGIVTVTIDQAQEVMTDSEDDPTHYVNENVVRGVLFRNTGQGRVKIADSITLGEEFVDYYAPLNQEYSYELLQVSSTGKISVLTQIAEVDTPYWYVYWGNNHENICRALWNPQGDVKLSRPDKELIRYSGREYPVSYDSSAMEETFSYGGVIIDRNELNNFILMIRNGGTGIWHSANGEAYDASFDFDYSADYTQNNLMWNCKLNVTRIE